MGQDQGHPEGRLALNRPKTPNVVLVGASGSGKTTVGQALARILGFGFLDVDKLIEKRTGKTVEAIFAELGEEGFRSLESETIGSLERVLNHVVVPGAGALNHEKSFELLKRLGPVVWLATPVSDIANRLLMKPDEIRKRPLLASAVEIENKNERRKYLYTKLEEMQKFRMEFYQKADKFLVTSFATPETTAQLIKSLLIEKNLPQVPADQLQ